MAARPSEISLTAWLDPVFKYFAEKSGIPVEEYSSQVGSEGIGVGLETVADFFTKGWLNKTIQATAGLIADGYAIWGKDVPTRLRRELLALGTHELLRFIDPKPSDIVEFQRSLTQFIEALKRGDSNAALASVFRTPGEIKAMMTVLGLPVATPAPESKPSVETETETKARGEPSVAERKAREEEEEKAMWERQGRYQVTSG